MRCGFCVYPVALLAVLGGLLTKPLPSLSVVQRPAVRAFEHFIDQLQFDGSMPWIDQFNGGMVPVPESRSLPMAVVQGQVPDVDGVYLRVGPNLGIYPTVKRSHVFDGDGMVYSVRLQNGTATYHAKMLETPRYVLEQQLGYEWFLRLGELYGWLGMAKLFTTAGVKAGMVGLDRLETSSANTAVGLTPDHKVWALNQAGYPFRFRVRMDGSIQSEGYDRLGGTLHSAVSAHPKYDYATGETFYHGSEMMKRFYAGRIKGGKVLEEVELPVQDGFQHDMFITRDYVVIIDGSQRFHPKNVAKRRPLWAFDQDHKLRFFVHKRGTPFTQDSFKVVTAPFAAEIVHICFGWNDGTSIKLFTPTAGYDPTNLEGVLSGNSPFAMKLLTIDVDGGRVSSEDVAGGAEFSSEFCRVRDDTVGGRSRYAFSSLQGSRDDDGIAGFNFTAAFKWDMEQKERVGRLDFPAGVVGGEPVFIPAGEGDDRGYLAMLWLDVARKASSFVMIDAQTMELAVELKVPTRVPLGFHGWWLSEEQLERQLAA